MSKLPKRHNLDFETWKKEALKDPEVRAEYDRLQPEFAVIRAVIDARITKGLTQDILAKKVGTKQSVKNHLRVKESRVVFKISA